MTTVTIEQALQLGLEHYNAARLREAEHLFRQVLAVVPDHPDTLNLLGLIAHQTGHQDDAIRLISRAAELGPQVPEYHNNLGEVLRNAGRVDEAIGRFREAIRLNERMGSSHFNLGAILWDKRQYGDAERHFTRASELLPGDPAVLNNLAEVLRVLGKYDEAENACRRAIELAPNLAVAYCNLGKVMRATNRNNDAVAMMRHAAALAPNHANILGTLANMLQSIGLPSEAVRLYERAIALDPHTGILQFNRAGALRLQGRVEEAIAAYQEALARRPDNLAGHSAMLLTMHCSSEITPEALFQAHLAWAHQIKGSCPLYPGSIKGDRTLYLESGSKSPSLLKESVDQGDCGKIKGPVPFNSVRLKGTGPFILRVGYVSPDLHVHPIGWFIDAALKLDRERFEVFVYADELRPDQVTDRLKTIVGENHWRNVTALNDDELARQILNDRIDILVDLAGHTADNRLLTFARKPAPVQATYLGYPNTTGLPQMDWRITDLHADPVGQTESLHTERLMRLPVCNWCYRPTDEFEVRPLIRDNRTQITFGTFNGIQKVSEACITLWAKLLKSVPDSKLLLKSAGLEDAGIRRRWLDRFSRHRIDPSRIELMGTVSSIAEHLGLYSRIDIALDTFPYNGTTTTCEALWMGVPVVTLAGRTHAARVGVSLLNAAGFPELVAESEDRYIEIAATLAADLDRGTGDRRTMRERLRHSALLDADRFCADLERAYRQMWDARDDRRSA